MLWYPTAVGYELFCDFLYRVPYLFTVNTWPSD